MFKDIRQFEKNVQINLICNECDKKHNTTICLSAGHDLWYSYCVYNSIIVNLSLLLINDFL